MQTILSLIFAVWVGGRFSTVTSMVSTGPVGVIITPPLASGKQTAVAAETTMSKLTSTFRSTAICEDGFTRVV